MTCRPSLWPLTTPHFSSICLISNSLNPSSRVCLAAHPPVQSVRCSHFLTTSGRWSTTILTATPSSHGALSQIPAKICTSGRTRTPRRRTSLAQQSFLAATKRSHPGHYIRLTTSTAQITSTLNTFNNRCTASLSPPNLNILHLHRSPSAHLLVPHHLIAHLARHPLRLPHQDLPHRHSADESHPWTERPPRQSSRRLLRTAHARMPLPRRKLAEDVDRSGQISDSKLTRSESFAHA